MSFARNKGVDLEKVKLNIVKMSFFHGNILGFHSVDITKQGGIHDKSLQGCMVGPTGSRTFSEETFNNLNALIKSDIMLFEHVCSYLPMPGSD